VLPSKEGAAVVQAAGALGVVRRRMMSLNVTFAGLELKNPLVAASATPTHTYSCLQKATAMGAAAVVPKSIVTPQKPGVRTGLSPRPRHHLMNRGIHYEEPSAERRDSLFTLMGSAEPYPTPEEFEPIIAKYKAEIQEPIIVSISGPERAYGEWKKLARRMEKAGADALELCLHHVPATDKLDPHLVSEIKDVVDLPIIAKTRMASERPEVVGPALQEAGADAITAISGPTLRGLEIDVERQRFVLQPAFCSFRGPWYRPIGLGWIARLAQCVDIDLSGVAGVVTWHDVVKYILVGATTVQVCSAIFAYGYEVLSEMVTGLQQYMEEKQYSSITEFKGVLLDELREVEALPSSETIVAVVNQKLCIGCKKCEDTCFYDAIHIEEKKAFISPSLCQGCGQCIERCPTGAIVLHDWYD